MAMNRAEQNWPEELVIELPDGFNGHTAKFYAEPLETNGNAVKLRCAETGKEYMTAWKRIR